jgi:hypothetical protein
MTAGAALIGGVLLAYPSGYLVDRLHRAGHSDAVLLVGTALAAVLAGLTALAATTSGVAIGAWVGLYTLLGIPTVLAGTAISLMTPTSMRAQVMAVHLLLMNMLSLSLGPFMVAVLTERIFGQPTAVGLSLGTIDAIAACTAAILFLTGRRKFKTICLAA